MVAGRRPGESPTPLSGPSPEQEAWFSALQRSLELEAERGFSDLTGHRERFSDFLARSCKEPPGGFPASARETLMVLAEGFSAYARLSPGRRQTLVRQCRERLHRLRQALHPPQTIGPPRLRLSPASSRAGASGAVRAASGAAIAPGTPLAEIKGIGGRTATRLAALGMFVARDLVRYYPRDYLDYSNLLRIGDLVAGQTATVVATVRRCHVFNSPRNPNLSIQELQLQDISGRLKVSRFFAGRRFSAPGWLRSQERQFPPGCRVAVSGLVKEGPYGLSLQDPLIEVLESAEASVRSDRIGRLLPVYGLTEGLAADRLRQAIQSLLPAVERWGDPLPKGLLQQEGLTDLSEALHQIHGPSNAEQLSASRRRLVFDEFLLLQLGLLRRRLELTSRPAPPLNLPSGEGGLVRRYLDLLPFALTGAQRRVLAEIRADLARPQPMARLVQGDVGSGKTVVAVAALLTAVEAGHQGALMAPTEVLAEQHYHKLCEWMPQLHVTVALLTGSTPQPRRRALLQDLENGSLRLLVGTHALLEDPVRFDQLALVVVDEQHRFGVRQRNRLLAKGLQPHLLTMTATPIPRTLALSIHGDLDVSQIDELPPGRTPIETRLLRPGQRSEAYELIRGQVQRGHRAYVVLPLVEESEKLDLRSAIEVHAQLQEQVFPELRVGLLHGRLSSAEKQAAIAAFARGDTDVLVSTTVVEVGVDVPEASVMVIDHAERFGLSQLHQLRGRVGRGAAASHCLLIDDSGNAGARQRLEVLVRSGDGFEIAEMDLRLRGPGQVLGTRQSGLPDLALASLCDDGAVLEQAREAARRLLAEDPTLERHPALAQALADQRQRTSEAAQLN